MLRRLALLLIITLGACSEGGGFLGTPAGPDEFMIKTQHPLSIPQNTTTLPPPDPAAGNRADIDQRRKLAAALQ